MEHQALVCDFRRRLGPRLIVAMRQRCKHLVNQPHFAFGCRPEAPQMPRLEAVCRERTSRPRNRELALVEVAFCVSADQPKARPRINIGRRRLGSRRKFGAGQPHGSSARWCDERRR